MNERMTEGMKELGCNFLLPFVMGAGAASLPNTSNYSPGLFKS